MRMLMYVHVDASAAILIDDERYERVRALARQRGTSVATVIREALDRGLPRRNGGEPPRPGASSMLRRWRLAICSPNWMSSADVTRDRP